ncbi:hypothetical protein Tco_0682378 [Tanacetum coccineum]|uniref:Uncharacterized protein n=1 Tax=Tanacetum coccineum TaxID=301880 RepID=A0ABQ4XR00_9ASTR
MIRSMTLPLSESLVLFVTLQMTMRILENYNQQLILEFLLVMHQAGRVIESTTKELDESWKLFTFNSMSCLSQWLLCISDNRYHQQYKSRRSYSTDVLRQTTHEYLEPPGVERLVPHAPAVQVPVVSASTPSSTTIDQDAPSTNYSPSSSVVQPPILPQGVAVGLTIEDNPFAQADNEPFENVFAPEPSSDEYSSGDVTSAKFTFS